VRPRRPPDDRATGALGLDQHCLDLVWRPDVVGQLDSRRTVTAERGPEAKYHRARLEEADLVARLLGAGPTQGLVEGPRASKVCDAKRDKADALFHVHSIAPLRRHLCSGSSRPGLRGSDRLSQLGLGSAVVGWRVEIKAQ